MEELDILREDHISSSQTVRRALNQYRVDVENLFRDILKKSVWLLFLCVPVGNCWLSPE